MRKGNPRQNQVWKALADTTRRNLLEILQQGPQTTGDLCVKFKKLSRFAVMKHLRVLEETRLIRARRDGRLRWNHLDAAPIRELDRQWIRNFRK